MKHKHTLTSKGQKEVSMDEEKREPPPPPPPPPLKKTKFETTARR